MFEVGEIVVSELKHSPYKTTYYETISEINTTKNQIITFNSKEDQGNYRFYHKYSLTSLYILGYQERERTDSYKLRKLTLREKIKLCLN